MIVSCMWVMATVAMQSVGLTVICPVVRFPLEESFWDGINGVDGLQSVNAMILTNDDQFLYASGYDSDAVSWYERNASDGNLTFVGKIQDNTGGVNGLDGAGMIKLSSDESTLYVLGVVDSSISWFDRNSSSGALTYVGSVTDGAGGVDGLGAVTSFDLTTSGTQLYATSQQDNSIAWFDINSTTGSSVICRNFP